MCNIVTEFYLYSIVYIYLINSRLDVTFSVRHHFRIILYHRLAANAKIYLENGVKFLEKSWKNPGILWLRKSGNPAYESIP